MIAIVLFAVYVIATKRVRVTRSFTIVGDNARNFGIGLLALTIPLRDAIRFCFRTFAPSAQAGSLPQAIHVVLFVIATLSMMFYFRNPPVEIVVAGDAASLGHPGVDEVRVTEGHEHDRP